jgi:hypothetical protein
LGAPAGRLGLGSGSLAVNEFQAIAVEGANHVSVLSKVHDKILRWMNN